MENTNLLMNFQNLLPLNRKEKFYTGTVLPQIICYDNFKYFNRFTNLINNFPRDLSINPDSSSNNIQFMTEYSLNESYRSKEGNLCFKNVPTSKETPDVVILITEPELMLIVVEAKMYSSGNTADFISQFNDQKKIVNCIKENLQINEKNIYHLALLPKEYFIRKIDADFQIICWEDIIKSYEDILKGNYFYSVLEYALFSYSHLRSSINSFSYGKNMDKKLSGLQIMEEHNSGKRFSVGRNLGLSGAKFQNDISTGGWETFEYEINNSSEPPNRNWFSSEQFVNSVKKIVRVLQPENNENNIGDWHFSHLGKSYFGDIALVATGKYSLNVGIKVVYIGSSGEPYCLIHKGRNINPNWCVILEDGREIKYNKTLKKLMSGLWNKGNCKVFDWNEIKNHKW